MLATRLLGSFPGGPHVTYSGNLVADGAAVNIDTTGGYKAFPGTCVAPNGDLLVTARFGATHISIDGSIAVAISTDQGLTYGSWDTVYDPATDARDPSLVTLSDGRIALSWFDFDGTLGTSVKVMYSSDNGATWGSPITMTSTFSVEVACSAPIVEVNPSLLLQPIYGRSGVAWEAAVLKSTDGGTTWGSQVLIASGGNDWTEPWIVKYGGQLRALLRGLSPAQIWISNSNIGASWGSPYFAFNGASRVGTLLTHTNGFHSIYRKAVGTGAEQRTSWDGGVTWESPVLFTSAAFEYAASAQFDDGRIVTVWSQEASSSDADLYLQAYFDAA